MGDAFIRLRKYKEAVEMLEKVIELAKPEDVIYEAIGHCYDRMKNYAQARFYYRKASHLHQDDHKLFYKIACTYFNEGHWENCIKQLTHALRIDNYQSDYSLLMGECKMQLGLFKEAVQFFTKVVELRPRKTSGWEALIRCLYKGEYYEEALGETQVAITMTKGKTLFIFYRAAILLAMGKGKEAIVQLEKAMNESPKMLKKFVELNPSILQNQQVVDVIARFKRNKSI